MELTVMKTLTSSLMIGAAILLNGEVKAANINNLPTSVGGSDLVLFVTVDNAFYVQDLGIQVSALKSQSQLATDFPGQYSLDYSDTPGDLPVPNALTHIASSNLTAFLSTHDTTNMMWSIMGGSRGNGRFQDGQQSFVITSTIDQFNAYWETTMVAIAQNNLNTFFQNINFATYTNGVSNTTGWNDAFSGRNADVSFSDFSHANGAYIGTSQNLYLMSATQAGLGANTYVSQYTFNLSSTGELTYSSPVPVPAAVYLLSSGLGWLGVLRRRRKIALA